MFSFHAFSAFKTFEFTSISKPAYHITILTSFDWLILTPHGLLVVAFSPSESSETDYATPLLGH